MSDFSLIAEKVVHANSQRARRSLGSREDDDLAFIHEAGDAPLLRRDLLATESLNDDGLYNHRHIHRERQNTTRKDDAIDGELASRKT